MLLECWLRTTSSSVALLALDRGHRNVCLAITAGMNHCYCAIRLPSAWHPLGCAWESDASMFYFYDYNTRGPDLTYNWPRLTPNGTNLGLFKISFLFILARRAKMNRKMILKRPTFVPYSAILTKFKFKSDDEYYSHSVLLTLPTPGVLASGHVTQEYWWDVFW